jgi:Na+-translocating ferredoxin:NAD+ oxidoreductase subunit G
MKTAARYVLTLAPICAVAALVLATLFDVTQGPIAASRQRVTLAAVRTVLPRFDRIAHPAALKVSIPDADAPAMYAAFDGANLVGAAIQVTDPDGYGGDVTFMVGVTAECRVHAIRLLAHKETPGLGTKLAEVKFASQFQDLAVPDGGLKVARDGGTIQAITGATISSRTAVRSASRAVEAFRRYQQHLMGAASAATPAPAQGELGG